MNQYTWTGSRTASNLGWRKHKQGFLAAAPIYPRDPSQAGLFMYSLYWSGAVGADQATPTGGTCTPLEDDWHPCMS